MHLDLNSIDADGILALDPLPKSILYTKRTPLHEIKSSVNVRHVTGVLFVIRFKGLSASVTQETCFGFTEEDGRTATSGVIGVAFCPFEGPG